MNSADESPGAVARNAWRAYWQDHDPDESPGATRGQDDDAWAAVASAVVAAEGVCWRLDVAQPAADRQARAAQAGVSDPAGGDSGMTWVRAMAVALPSDKEYRIPTVPSPHAFRVLFDQLRAQPSPAADVPMREAFEAAMRKVPCPNSWTFESDGTGGFDNHATEWAWIAWQAALAHQRGEKT